MLRLRLTRRAAIVSALLLTVGAVAPASAQDAAAALDRAIKLFEAGDYLTAQELLVGIDRDQLVAQHQEIRDDLLNRTQFAITLYEKALRDLEDAETAMNDGEVDRAKELLDGVLANEYAPQTVRNAALAHQRNLDGDAATQTSPDGETVAEESFAPPAGVTSEDMQRARSLTRQGDDMVAGGRHSEAERLYTRALDAVPGYPEAVDGLHRVAQHQEVTTGTRAESLLERIVAEDRIRWQRSVAEYRDVEAQIRDHVNNERFDEANQSMVRARQIVEAGRGFANPVAKYESLKSEVGALGAFVTNEERGYHERKVAQTRRQIEEQRKARQAQDAENRRRQVDALMSQARQHRKDGDLTAALAVLKSVTVIDPKYEPARWLMDDLDELRAFRQGRRLRDEFYREQRGALLAVEEAKIPWHVELLYPRNWPEIISRPDRVGPGGARSGARLFAALDKPISVDFADDPFDQVIAQLTETHRLPIIVNWNDLEAAGIARDTPIDLYLPVEISLKRALTEIVEQAGSRGNEVGFEVFDGIIKIATQATLDEDTYTAVYDINDLLMEIPNFKDAPFTDLEKSIEQSLAQRLNRGTTPWATCDDADDEAPLDPQRASRLQTIIDLIQETVAHDSWRERGGTVGVIKEINGQLVITQNSAAQRQIDSLLGKLREQRAIQIAVEARFLTVSSHYLEELGIDIDIVLNSGNAGFDYIPTAGGVLTDPVHGSPLLLPRTFSRLGFTPNSPALGAPFALSPQLSQPFSQPFLIPQQQGGFGSQATPIPIINRVSSFTDPALLGSDVPGSFAGSAIGPAFTLFGSFLDNIQVDILIRATQADSRTTVLTAPQLVLFNGQRSWVAVTIQQNYIATLNPVVAQGAVAQAPGTAVINSGAVLDVNATVTADKRYVTMTLRPGITRLLDLQTIPFSGGAAGGGFGGGGTALSAFVQLPTLSSQRLQTTVSVPDGGTLLLGGQKLASETEIEAGVPILSKIPILKRIYSSRSTIKDEQTLLILIKPKILIQAEQEQLAFPSFGPG